MNTKIIGTRTGYVELLVKREKWQESFTLQYILLEGEDTKDLIKVVKKAYGNNSVILEVKHLSEKEAFKVDTVWWATMGGKMYKLSDTRQVINVSRVGNINKFKKFMGESYD